MNEEPPAYVPAETPVVDASNPWVGLSTFTEDQRSYFFGRKTESEELLRLVRREPLTVLFGLSGLGKSSLLQAGVFPALRSDGWLPVSIRLSHSVAAAPAIEQIKEAMSRAVQSAGLSFSRQPSPGESLWEFFHSRDSGVFDAQGVRVTLLLAFDQFEEIFTLGKSSDATGARRAALLAELADLVENRVPEALRGRLEQDATLIENLDFDRCDCRVLVSLREDYLAELESLRAKIPLILQNRMRLKPMDGRQAMQAVLGPGGKLVCEKVAERIVRFVSHSRQDDTGQENPDAVRGPLENLRVEPSLLSLFCRELNTRRTAQNLTEITPELLESSSGRILQDFYEQCFDGQPEPAREFIEEELLTDAGFRENMAMSSARKRLKARGIEEPDAVIETLVMRRLLHIEERQDLQRIELTHDVLTDVVMKSRMDRRKREEEIEARRREAAREAAVAQAKESEQAALRQLRNTRRRSAFFALLSFFSIAALVVAVFSYREAVRQGAELERQKQRETELATAARRDASFSDMITASTITRGSLARAGNIVALLCRAVERDPSNRTAFVSLLSLLAGSNWPTPDLPAINLPNSPSGASFSPDGRRFIVFYGNTVGVWDAATGGEMEGSPTSFPSKVLCAEFGPDSSSFVTVLQDGTAAIRGTPGAPEISPRDVKLGEGITLVKFSDDKRFLAAAAGHDIHLLEIAAGHITDINADGEPLAMRFTPDGTRLAASIQIPGLGGMTRGWKTADGVEIPALSSRWDSEPRILAFSPDGSSIAVSGKESVLVRQDKSASHATLNLSSEVTCVKFSPDGYYLAAGSRNGEAVIARNPEFDPGAVAGGDSPLMQEIVRATWGGPVVSIEFSPDAMRALVAIADGTVWLLDVAEIHPSDKNLGTSFGARIGRNGGWIKSQPIRQSGEIVTAKFSPDGRRVLVASKNNAVRIWKILPNQMQPTLLPSPPPVASSATQHTAQGDFLLTASERKIRLLAQSGGPKAAPREFSLPDAAECVRAVDLSDDGTLLAASAGKQVFVWDLRTPEAAPLLIELKAPPALLSFMPGGNTLGVAAGRLVLLFTPGSTRPSASLSHAEDVGWMRFLPDGTLVTCSGKEVWQWRGGIPLGEALAHSANISTAATSPDGDFLITGCDDDTVRIWELDSGLLIFERSFPGMGSPAVSFNADASAFFTVFHDCALAWDFPGNVTAVPKDLPALGFAISGTEFSGNRVRVSLSDSKKQLDEASAAVLRDRTAARQPWARWLARIGDKDRPASPTSPLTYQSLAEKFIDSGTRQNLLNALLLSPCNPQALQKLAVLLRDKDPLDPRGAFLDKLAQKHESP